MDSNLRTSITLEQRRKELGKSQKDVARLVGVGQAIVSMWEQGKKTPTLDNAVKLARALELDLVTLAMSMGIDVSGLPPTH